MGKKLFTLTLLALFLLCNFTPVLASEESTPSGIPLSKMEEKIDEHVNKFIGKSTPGAAIGVVKNGKVIFSKGYGYADIEKKTPINPKTTIFEYGSISKLFVWTSVMKLSEEGKLDLNKDIKTYLPPNFSSKLKYKKPITMNHIMTHTAGFEEYVIDISSPSPELKLSLEEALIKLEPNQIYEPGTVPAYSNYATALAAYIVKKISGESFSSYEKNNIFIPCNMKTALSMPTTQDTENFKATKAIGYKGNNGDFKKREWFNVLLYPSGSVNGTLDDLIQFSLSLTKGNEKTPLFKNKETLNAMLTPSKNIDNHKSITHGFLEYNGEGYTLGHGGHTFGFSTELAIVPNESFGVVILTNASFEGSLINDIKNLLTGKKDNDSSINTNSSNNTLPHSKEIQGSYVNSRRDTSSFLELKSYLEPGSLIKIKSLSENKIELYFNGYKEFFVQTTPGTYTLLETPNTKADFKREYPTLYFDMKSDKVNYLSLSPVKNYTPLSTLRTMPWLVFSIAILIVSAIYFIISPFIFLIRKLINKKGKLLNGNTIYKSLYISLTLTGTVTLLNNIILLIRILQNNLISSTALNPQIVFNWVLLIVTIILIILLLINYKKIIFSKKESILNIVTIIIITLFMFLLINWNFFSILK